MDKEESKLWWCCTAEFGEHEENCGNHPINKKRIEHLNDMAECLIKNWKDEPKVKIDLDEIIKAINDRIELIKKGEV